MVGDLDPPDQIGLEPRSPFLFSCLPCQFSCSYRPTRPYLYSKSTASSSVVDRAPLPSPVKFSTYEHSVRCLPGYIPSGRGTAAETIVPSWAPAAKESYLVIIRHTALRDGVLRAIMAIRPSKPSKKISLTSVALHDLSSISAINERF